MNKGVIVLLVLLGAAALIGGGAAVVSGVRGLRNNNPGNIRRSADKWRGLAPKQTDPEFFQFESPLWGIRAMARVLNTYMTRHKLTTIHSVISRWAPPNENDTPAYIAAVSHRLGKPAAARLDFARDAPALVSAIITQENGSNPYSAALVQQAISLA